MDSAIARPTPARIMGRDGICTYNLNLPSPQPRHDIVKSSPAESHWVAVKFAVSFVDDGHEFREVVQSGVARVDALDGCHQTN